MPEPARNDAERVHVVETDRARGSKLPLILGLVLLVGLGAAGAWVAMADPFGDDVTVELPEPAADNLLGDAWSFETTESGGAGSRWTPTANSPGGFAFVQAAAVSGERGALADTPDAGWVKIVSQQPVRVDRDAVLELSATASGDALQLFVRLEGDGLPTLDLPVAGGSGALRGECRVLPGYRTARVGLAAIGGGAMDDVVLRQLPSSPAPSESLGIFQVRTGAEGGLSVLRGDELVLRVEPPAVRLPDGRMAPGSASWMVAGDQRSLALVDGTRVAVEGGTSSTAADGGLRYTRRLSGIPAGSTVVNQGLLSGSLAEAPVGLRSSRGYEFFTGDFRVDDIDALFLGRTQDRLELRLSGSFTAQVSHRPDGSVALSLERPAGSPHDGSVVLAAEFTDQRVAAQQTYDDAVRHERAGDLGAALRACERVAQEFPYDEQVLAQAQQLRARLQARMQARLDQLDADLDDALFLGSAARCREVRDEALAAADAWSGSEAEPLFRERAATVDERASNLLADDSSRRRGRLQALHDSFAAQGGYEAVVSELAEALEELP